jgi:hypothetical protein
MIMFQDDSMTLTIAAEGRNPKSLKKSRKEDSKDSKINKTNHN